MANKRMFSMSIVDSDAFLDMPATSQLLYFHLGMRADDDGFVNSPKRIQRMVGASEDDLKLLIAKGFLIVFESGVVVIKHWKINNTIQSDRYKETNYKEELSMLKIKKNKSYTLSETECLQEIPVMETECIQNVSKVFPQNRLDKISIDKNRKKEIIKKESDDYEIPDFDLESAWRKTREIYPRNAGKGISKQLYLDNFRNIFPSQYKDMANAIVRAIRLYISEYREEYGEDDKYIKSMDRWFKEDFEYYLDKAQERGGENGTATQNNE